MKYYTLTESELQELLTDKEKFYEQQVQNPYPTESQSNTAYKKGFYEAWDYLVKALLPTEEVRIKEDDDRFINWLDNQIEDLGSEKELHGKTERIRTRLSVLKEVKKKYIPSDNNNENDKKR